MLLKEQFEIQQFKTSTYKYNQQIFLRKKDIVTFENFRRALTVSLLFK